MKSETFEAQGIINHSREAKERLLATPGEPLFYGDWLRPVFLHYEVDAERLQRDVPFDLDLRDGKAYVSLVAFTMRGLRPAWGGRWTSWILAPISTHELLNVRTYVRHGDEPGIYFLAEWIPNRLSVLLGPQTFGLPYRLGRLKYRHLHEEGRGRFSGSVTAGPSKLRYSAHSDADPDSAGNLDHCPAGSLTEFLLERYTAFTSAGCRRKFFCVWHAPWLQMEIEASIHDDSLLRANFPWFHGARFVAANYSPVAEQVWMGRPHRVTTKQRNENSQPRAVKRHKCRAPLPSSDSSRAGKTFGNSNAKSARILQMREQTWNRPNRGGTR